MRLGGDRPDPEDDAPEDGQALYETVTEGIAGADLATQFRIADAFQRRIGWAELSPSLRVLYEQIAATYLDRID